MLTKSLSVLEKNAAKNPPIHVYAKIVLPHKKLLGGTRQIAVETITPIKIAIKGCTLKFNYKPPKIKIY
jgi:hypothetical protein